jgi:hypothetical protein
LVTVLVEECDEGGGCWLGGGETGEPGESSSGLAMRRPPCDCERLKSPDMLRGRSQCRWAKERRWCRRGDY